MTNSFGRKKTACREHEHANVETRTECESEERDSTGRIPRAASAARGNEMRKRFGNARPCRNSQSESQTIGGSEPFAVLQPGGGNTVYIAMPLTKKGRTFREALH